MRRLKVKVHKTELAVLTAVIWPWELPMLEAIHANGVTVEGELPSEGQPPPDPAEEYERLERKYKVFREDNGDPTDRTVVGEVYGRHQAGIRALADAINAEAELVREIAEAALESAAGDEQVPPKSRSRKAADASTSEAA